jgi:hypothetical protein
LFLLVACILSLSVSPVIILLVVPSFYNYGCLWLYTAVFAHALALHFPLFASKYESYVFFACLFALIVVPFSCLDLTEQVGMQLTLSLCRVLVIVIMVSTSLIAFINNDYSPLDGADPSPAINMSGFSTILSICAYAFLFSQGLPVLAEPASDKRQLRTVFLYTLVFMVVGYTSIGVSVALVFGSDIRSSCNLLWGAYTMGGASSPVLVLMAKAVSAYVVLFPALDCLSAYPLMAIMLGNSIFVCFSARKRYVHNSQQASPPSSPAANGNTVIFCRLLAAVPPIIGAVFISNPGAITNYTGISGIIIGFVFPPLLSMQSEKYLLDRKLPHQTIYSTKLSTMLRPVVLCLGGMLCVFVLTMNVLSPASFHEDLEQRA